MKQYRKIQYKVWNKHFIKLINPEGLIKNRDFNNNLCIYRTGEAFVSLPDDLEMGIDEYVQKIIDTLFDRKAYHEREEMRRIMSQKSVEIL